MNKDFDRIASYIMGTCYTDMTKPAHIDFLIFCYEHLDGIDKEKEVAHVFGWLIREGFIRCLDEQKSSSACVKTELTLKGRNLLEGENGNMLIEAIKKGSIELAATVFSKIITG
jgi:hypothetical protein